VPFESCRTDPMNREPPVASEPPRLEPVNPKSAAPFESFRTDPMKREPPVASETPHLEPANPEPIVPFGSSRTDPMDREPPMALHSPRIEPVSPKPAAPFDYFRTDPMNREPRMALASPRIEPVTPEPAVPRAIALAIESFVVGDAAGRRTTRAPRKAGIRRGRAPDSSRRTLGVLAVHSAAMAGIAGDRSAPGRWRPGNPVKQLPNAIPLTLGRPSLYNSQIASVGLSATAEQRCAQAG